MIPIDMAMRAEVVLWTAFALVVLAIVILFLALAYNVVKLIQEREDEQV